MSLIIAYGILVLLTGIAAYWDLKWKRIPNFLTMPGLIIGLCFSFQWGCLPERLIGLASLLILSWIIYIFFHHWIGMGDMKLWMMCSAFTGLFPSFCIFTCSQLLLLLWVIIRGKIRQVKQGFQVVVLFHLRPEATETCSLGVFFLISVLIYAAMKAGGVV